MATSLIDADSLLAIDVGSTHTRAMFFDAVEDRYHLIALGVAPTTLATDVREGIYAAITQIEHITGRRLTGDDGEVILPAEETVGVDQVVMTLSAGKPLQVVVAGVLPQISLQSARRLAETIYGKIAAQLHLNDRLQTEGRINTIARVRPDVIIMAGGIEGGASRAVLQMVEAVGLAAYLLPEGQRPEVLFSGNSRLHAHIKDLLEGVVPLHITANVRPAVEEEQLGPAEEALLEIYRRARERQISGLQDFLAPLHGKSAFYPTAYAFSRIVRFLSGVYDPAKGVLGVDVGAEAATIAAAWGGESTFKVLPELGLGSNLPNLLRSTAAERLLQWLPFELAETDLVDYLYNKALHPESVPVTEEDLAIELALTRQVLRVATQKAWRDFPTAQKQAFGAQLPYFDPILASGSILTQSASPAQALLTLLDGIQPSGIATFVLDANHLLPALGAAADFNPILSVQALESHHFVSLATVIAVSHRIRKAGASILRMKIKTDSGEARTVEIKTGQIKVIPLRPGQSADLTIQPLRQADAGFGFGHRGKARVNGSLIGLVIDARGRPIPLSPDPQKRIAQNKHWLQALGG